MNTIEMIKNLARRNSVVASSDVIALIEKMESTTTQLAAVVAENAALAVENGRLCNRITHAEGCFSAAIFEGLNEALIESFGSNLADIVSRRIVYAFPSIGEQTPATDAAVAAIEARGVGKLAERYRTAAKLANDDGEFRAAHRLALDAARAEKFASELREGK